MYRFQLGLTIVMKRKFSQNLQETIKIECKMHRKDWIVCRDKKRKAEKIENKTWIFRRETEETNRERKKENFSDSEN